MKDSFQGLYSVELVCCTPSDCLKKREKSGLLAQVVKISDHEDNLDGESAPVRDSYRSICQSARQNWLNK